MGKTPHAVRVLQEPHMPLYFPRLARAHAELGQFEETWGCVGEAMTAVETTKEKWCEAEIHRTAGELTPMSPEPDTAKAEAHFERALAVAPVPRAKSWELRTATSMARLRRDQGKRTEARDLLAPIYNWFTEGFDTPDLKAAKALLELAQWRCSPDCTSTRLFVLDPLRPSHFTLGSTPLKHRSAARSASNLGISRRSCRKAGKARLSGQIGSRPRNPG